MGHTTSAYDTKNTVTHLSARDQKAIWHPYTQHQLAPLPIAVVRGQGAYLFDEQGKSYLDLISSWWVNLFGHAHPLIAKAIYEQALRLEQVIFSGFTHEPAVLLAEQLLSILPSGLGKIFYSDNGSTAVEVALKMAYQYWRNQGEGERQRFLAFSGGYHGDTLGAMAVGRSSSFFNEFERLLFHVDIAPYPATWLQDVAAIEKEQQALAWLDEHLQVYGKNTAALLIEPLIQGASGMNMCSIAFLQAVECLARQYGILIIYDEVMTGFGRSGALFACTKAKTHPDIICLAKGLTGGFLPLAVTACKDFIYEAFLSSDIQKTLFHGHTYTANPLGCAAGLASLSLLQSVEIQTQIKMIERVHSEILEQAECRPGMSKPRYSGTVAAFDVQESWAYGSVASQNLRAQFLQQGLLIRPLGNVVYLMPPYCVTEGELRAAYEVILRMMQ